MYFYFLVFWHVVCITTYSNLYLLVILLLLLELLVSSGCYTALGSPNQAETAVYSYMSFCYMSIFPSAQGYQAATPPGGGDGNGGGARLPVT